MTDTQVQSLMNRAMGKMTPEKSRIIYEFINNDLKSINCLAQNTRTKLMEFFRLTSLSCETLQPFFIQNRHLFKTNLKTEFRFKWSEKAEIITLVLYYCSFVLNDQVLHTIALTGNPFEYFSCAFYDSFQFGKSRYQDLVMLISELTLVS